MGRTISKPQRLDLEWVRGLAALAVALLHCREIGWVGLRQFAKNQSGQGMTDIVLAWLFSPVVWGSAGVSIFFVLSGYVIHTSAATHLRRDPAWKLDIKDFYLRRFVRIYSVLVAAIVLTYILDEVSATFAPFHPNLGDRSLRALVGNLLAFQGTLVHPFGSNGPLWTLAIEIHFYAIYPVILLARRRWSPLAILVSGIAISVTSWLLLPQGIEFFTTYLVCWLLGFYAAELRVRHSRINGSNATTAAILFGAAGCGAFFFSQHAALLLWSFSFYFYLLTLFGRPAKAGPFPRSLAFLGTISYTLYVIHEPIAVFLVATLHAGEQSYSMPFVLFMLLVVLAASTCMYFLVERRAVRWLTMRASQPPAIALKGSV